MSKHTDLIDAVNDAAPGIDKEIAEATLRGFLLGLDFCGRTWSGIDMDRHTMERIGNSDTPMCCGVLL